MVFILWFVARYSTVEGFDVLKNLWKFSNNFVLYVVLYGVFVLTAWGWNGDVFSLANVTRYDKKLSFALLFDYAVFFPVMEELLFRAFAMSLLLNRTKQRSNQRMLCCVLNGVLFGGFHLLNIYGSRLSLKYVLFQTFLSTIGGIAYSAHILNNQSLLEVVVIHICNNIYAIVFPQTLVTNMSDVFVLYNFMGNCALITLLFYMNKP